MIERKNKLQNVQQQIPKLEKKDGFIRYNSKKLTIIYEKYKLEIIQTSKKLAKLLLLFKCQTSLLHDSIVRKVWILRLTPCKGLKSSTLSHNFV